MFLLMTFSGLVKNENHHILLNRITATEAAFQRCSYEKVFWKYVADLQENTHTEVRFQ